MNPFLLMKRIEPRRLDFNQNIVVACDYFMLQCTLTMRGAKAVRHRQSEFARSCRVENGYQPLKAATDSAGALSDAGRGLSRGDRRAYASSQR